MKLSENIDRRLIDIGMTQRELAFQVGVTEVAISRYLKDERIPKADTLLKIATALKTTPDYLLGVVRGSDDYTYIRLLVQRNEAVWTPRQKLILINLLSKGAENNEQSNFIRQINT